MRALLLALAFAAPARSATKAEAPALCLPAPGPDDLPPAADKACAAKELPTVERLRADLDGDCGKLHRRVLSAAGRKWAADLDPDKGRLLGPLSKAPMDRRVLSLWNQDSDGKAACERSPHIVLCDPSERADWLARLFKDDDKLVARARDLYSWYLQAHTACESIRAQPDSSAVTKLESDRRRFFAELRRIVEKAADVDRLALLRADYRSAALDLEKLKAWDKALGAWSTALSRRAGAARPTPPPKPRRNKADTAPPD